MRSLTLLVAVAATLLAAGQGQAAAKRVVRCEVPLQKVPHAKSCTKYYECSSQQRVFVERECGEYQHFDEGTYGVG